MLPSTAEKPCPCGRHVSYLLKLNFSFVSSDAENNNKNNTEYYKAYNTKYNAIIPDTSILCGIFTDEVNCT